VLNVALPPGHRVTPVNAVALVTAFTVNTPLRVTLLHAPPTTTLYVIPSPPVTGLIVSVSLLDPLNSPPSASTTPFVYH
jgi:hypothetical protein